MALLAWRLLLAYYTSTRTLAGTRVRVRTLSPYRQTAAMANPSIAPDIHQPLDVHRDLGPQGTLDLEVGLDGAANLIRVLVGKRADPDVRIDASFLEYLMRGRGPDPIDIGQANLDPLVVRQIDAVNTYHGPLALPLLVSGIPLANNPHDAAAPNQLAMLAHALDARSYLHFRAFSDF